MQAWAACAPGLELLRRGANTTPARLERLACLAATLWRSSTLGPAPGKLRTLRHLRRGRVNKTKALPASLEVAVKVMPGFEAAVRYAGAAAPGAVGVVIVASGYQIGGAFLSAKHRSSEEEACLRSTLFPLLRLSPRVVQGDEGNQDSLVDPQGIKVWVPEDGALVCEGVHVLRGPRESGFAMLEERDVVELTVLAISLPNLGPCYATAKQGILGPPLGGMSPPAYEERVRQKVETVIQAAMSAGVRTLVISDEGCEELCNSSEEFGYIFGNCLATTRSLSLPDVVATGSQLFGASVRAGVADVINPRQTM